MGGQGTRERRVRAGGIELCVAEMGDAADPTVVLVHGYPDSKEVWSRVAERLADRFHVVLYDVRGHGGSTAPKPLRGGFTLAKLTDDFLAVVDAVSPDGPVHLVGHDWGSVQGWEFATLARTRGRIASFTSISGPALDHYVHWIRDRVARPTPRRAAALLRQTGMSWYIGLFHAPALPELLWRGPVGKVWPDVLRRLERLPDDGYPTASLARDAVHGLWLYRDNVRARLRDPRLDAVAHAPVQVIVPTGDGFLSPALQDDLERWAPRLTRRTLRARHWCPRTRPDQLAEWIAEFALAAVAGPEGAAGAEGPSRAAGSRGPLLRRAARSRFRFPARKTASEPARRPARDPRAERFGGRLVLVTGAANGIGRATALAFAAAGARVVAVDRDGEGAARVAGEARTAGAQAAFAETVDVADAEAMEKLAERVARAHGVVDVLVNNAGIGVSGPFLATPPEEWRRILDVNLWGVLHGCRLFGRQMAARGQGGHIVTIASAAAYQPSRSLSAYGTTKAAVLMLSQSLRAELAGKDIGVSAVCPGLVLTGITATTRFVGVDAAEERRLRERAGRLYRFRSYPPEKVADAVVRSVLDNRAVVTVTPEARALLALSRFAPGAARALARL
ncbi:SDR family oxidoreductase [Streptomyces yaizuensis]|uniref:SDR family oxidoreductase n=1 Tax=Streptomyces yaizuensis TaxID=2989713 RepID=A0ABQ5NZH5_9ACTN|nr:SDR family oxidoreductase [Streptomyces sp. YSPA8]GLF95764.1 SDR family oxidoreductase [Streptomyces sp. YSPA8]